MQSSSSNPSAISVPRLRATFDGRVIAPDDAGYDQARGVFYGSFDRRPAVIVRPADMVRPMPYPEIYQFTEGGPSPEHEAARSLFLDAVDRPTAETIVEHLQASTAPLAVAQLRVLGGAMARVPADATAFAHRGRRVMAAIGAVWERPGAAEAAVHEAWVIGFAAALRQGDPGVYVNFVGDEGQGRVREAYPGSTWERLTAVKARYDPTNLFRLNQNIPPAPPGDGTAG